MLQLFAVFAFFLLGFACVCLPFFDHLRFQLVQILLEEVNRIVWIGVGFFCFTFLLTMGFYSLSKGRFLLLKMGARTLEVDVKVLKKTIPPFLYKQFSARVLLTDLEIFKKQQLRIGLSIAPMEEKEQEKTLLDAERHLQTLLSERFGYNRPFVIQLKQ